MGGGEGIIEGRAVVKIRNAHRIAWRRMVGEMPTCVLLCDLTVTTISCCRMAVAYDTFSKGYSKTVENSGNSAPSFIGSSSSSGGSAFGGATTLHPDSATGTYKGYG